MMKKNNSALIRRDNNALIRRAESTETRVVPAVDVFETPESFVLRVDMPGADRETLRVSVNAANLEISGRVATLHKTGASVVRGEIVRKSYYRVFNLTAGLETGRMEAEFENGVLSIVIPKSEHLKTKIIPIS